MWTETYHRFFDEVAFLLLCRACAEAKVRFALVLDNVDAYHYAYSSRSFLREGRQAQVTSIQANITQLFSRLASTDGLGAAGLAVIIACRDTVYDECSIHERPLDHYSRSSWGRTYRLEPKSEQVALSARLELIHHAIVALLHQHKGLQSFFDALDFEKTFIAHGDFTESQRDSVLAIRDLSHHGLRSFVDFVSKLKVDYDNKGEIFWRTFNNAARPMRIMYMSGLKRRFSEFNLRFPNIFLNDATVTRNGAEPIDPPISHRHTYWLRYLILKFVQISAGAVLAREVIDFFVDRCFYEEELVRLMLGELCSENELNCLRAETIGRGIDDRRIKLTSRGSRLVERGYGSGNRTDPELVFNFDYLQLVIDDYLMALPAVKVSLQGKNVSCLDRIYVKADLQYLFLPGREHDRGLVAYFKAKADATVCFLRILQAAFEAESQRFREVFTEYPELDVSQRFDNIFEELLKGLRRILDDVPDATDIAFNARLVCDQIRKDQRLDDFFRDYYALEDQVFVS